MFWPTMKTFGARLVRLSDVKRRYWVEHRYWAARPTSLRTLPGGTSALPARPRPPIDRRTI